ncbi:MAG: UDP-glucose/GDP-mannose dehydrogenase family protein [Chlorobi bacterium]|nr:UDP-glucose/GDP-mannose dehydrogenase family protein [Chlorobiota bacterium]
MKIAVIGTGYVGLVTGTCFAETGIEVYCIDIDPVKIKMLNEGKTPIYEPGLEPMIRRNLEKQRLFFSTDMAEGIRNAEVVFIAVGTPPDEDGSADLKHVLNVAGEIGELMDKPIVVVTKSTVPVGTADAVRKAIRKSLKKRGTDINFDVVSNPEFLKEGNAVQDFLKPDRIIIGLDSDNAEVMMRKLYKPFLLNQHPIYFMDIPSAEMTKYAANAMLATKISFINDIANLCERVSADVEMVRRGIGSDPRIGYKFIYPGTGYGGSCFPKDIKALIRTADEKGYSLEVLKAVDRVNEQQKSVLFNKIMHHFNGQIKGLTFGVWGLSFKPLTDDIREAPSLTLIKLLLEQGAKVKAYDPAAMEAAKRILGNRISYSKEPYDAIIDADAIVLVTEWPEFRNPNFQVVDRLLKQKLIFDGRNIYDPHELQELGFTYYGIGRKNGSALA